MEKERKKRPWSWEKLRAGGQGDDRGWGGWMASLTQWTWVWVDSGSWWWTGRPGVLWLMGLQGVNTWWTQLSDWTELYWYDNCIMKKAEPLGQLLQMSNQSILKEISPEYLCAGLMLKFQSFGHLMWRDESLEKTMSLRKIEGKREGSSRGWDGWLNEHEFEPSLGDSGWQRSLACCSPWGSKEVDTNWWLNKNNKYLLDLLLIFT